VTIRPDTAVTHSHDWNSTALNGMSLEQVSDFRLERVSRFKRLNIFPSDYRPLKDYHRKVYDTITSGKEWLSPAVYYIANPYVLIVMVPANHVTALNLHCPDVSIRYDNGTITERHSGSSADCWFEKVYGSYDYPGVIRPVMVNAWDAGYFYIHVDVKRSLNIKVGKQAGHITNSVSTARSYFHVGKYGVNNISPTVPKHWLNLETKGAETRIHVKLWRNRPARLDEPPSLTYITHIRKGTKRGQARSIYHPHPKRYKKGTGAEY
ncbi:MAG: hypothetical protein GY940_05910, partial [bacterium]|nr:hypothetical protein [bacterium]